jgi:hypothetical protein
MMARFNSTDNRGGRRRGAKDKLQTDFLRDLADAWELEGVGALRIMVKEEPAKFVQVVAGLMPREVQMELAGPLGELSDQELTDMLEVVRQLRASTINGKAIEIGAQPALVEGETDGQTH